MEKQPLAEIWRFGKSEISEIVWKFGNFRNSGNLGISGNVHISEISEISGKSEIFGNLGNLRLGRSADLVIRARSDLGFWEILGFSGNLEFCANLADLPDPVRSCQILSDPGKGVPKCPLTVNISSIFRKSVKISCSD